MNIELLEGERIDDLERNGLKIIQNKKEFCFGIDAVLLSVFAAEGEGGKVSADRRNKKILDLGTGTGILPLLLYAKTDAGSIIGLEIQPQSADMAARSVKLNHLEEVIRIVEGDIKEATVLFGRSSFDAVTCNPPYMKAASGIINPLSSKAIARHEVLCTFEDIAFQVRNLLKPGGKFYLVHRPQRLPELITVLKQHRLEPKRMRMVHSFADSEATLVLLEAVSGGHAEMRVEKPLCIYDMPGKYTEEIRRLYYF